MKVTVTTSLYKYTGPTSGITKDSENITFPDVTKYDVNSDGQLYLLLGNNTCIVYARGAWQTFTASDIEDSQ